MPNKVGTDKETRFSPTTRACSGIQADDSHGRRSRTPWYRTSFIVFRKYVHLQGLPSALELHFIVTLVLVYILNTHRTGARTRAQQDRAGLSRHDRNPPPGDQAQQYFFVVLLFKKARTF